MLRVRTIYGRMVEFYQRTIYSTQTLATGGTGFNPFAAEEAASNLRNYSLGQNFFISNQGGILAMQATLHGPGYAAITDVASAAAGDILQEFNKLIMQGQVQIYIDSRPVAMCMLSDIVGTLPVTSQPAATDPASPVFAQGQSLYNRDAAFNGGLWNSPPILVPFGRTIQFRMQYANGVAVPVLLNTYIIQYKLILEEYPNVNVARLRPAVQPEEIQAA